MILHNHGLVALGSTVEEAFANVVLLVKACEYQVGCCLNNYVACLHNRLFCVAIR